MEPSPKKIRGVLLAALLANLGLAFGKLYAGWQLDSLAVLADAVHSLLGAAACTINLAVLCLAALPAAESLRRPRKFEVLATLAIGVVLLLDCWELTGSVAQGLMQPAVAPRFSAGGMLFLVAALGVNYAVYRYQRLQADDLNSPRLAADAGQFKTQLPATALTLFSLGSAKTGWWRFDAIAAIIIIIIIGLAVGALVYESVNRLANANRDLPLDRKSL
jgi:cation diffusion facilitator family transporter